MHSVQDHVLDMQNGKQKPNHRRDFQYGDSLQISAAELASTIKRKVLDLVKRAGSGPTCRLSIVRDSSS